MRNTIILICCIWIVGMTYGQMDSVSNERTPLKSKRAVLPSYRYMNLSNHAVGLIFTNTKLGETFTNHNNLQYWIEPLYIIKESWSGKIAISKKMKSSGIFHAIEPQVSFKRFPFFYQSSLDYRLHYNKWYAGARFFIKDEYCSHSYLSIAGMHIREQFALFSGPNEYTISNLPTTVLRAKYDLSDKDEENFMQSLKIQLDYTNYKTPLDQSKKFTRLDLDYRNLWRIGSDGFFELSFYGAVFLQNDQREVNSFSNELVKGSIALSQQGFTDYAYDENFASRRNTTLFWDNQISSISGGGMKLASTIGSSIGLSNDYAFTVRSHIALPGTGKYFTAMAYFDVGGYHVDKMKYLYSGGLAIGVKRFITLYIPIINNKDINQHYSSNGIDFLERLNFKIKTAHYFSHQS